MKPTAVTPPVFPSSSFAPPSLSGISVILLSVSALLSVYFNAVPTIETLPLFSTVQISTVLGLILLGAGLYELDNGAPRVAICCAGLVACFAALVLFLHAFENIIRVGAPLNQTIELNTSLYFLFCGAAIVLSSIASKGYRAMLGLVLLGIVLSVFASIPLISYLSALAYQGDVRHLTQFESHTALALFILSVGIVLHAKLAAKNIESIKILSGPLAVLGGGVAVTILLWQSLVYEEGVYSRGRLLSTANQIKSAISADFEANINALDRMRQRWLVGSDMRANSWLNDANNYIEDSRLFDGLFVLDGEHNTWLTSVRHPANEKAHAAGSGTSANKAEFELFTPKPAFEESDFAWHPTDNTFQIVMPVSKPSFAAAIVAEVDADRWFKDVSSSYLNSGVFETADIKIRFSPAWSKGSDVHRAGQSVVTAMRIADKDWQIEVSKGGAWRGSEFFGLATVVLIAGLSVSSLLAAAFLFWLKLRNEAAELEASNIVLADAYSEKEKAEKHLKLLLDNAAEGIFGLNAAGLTTFVNPIACSILGVEQEEILGKSMHSTVANFQLYAKTEAPFLSHMCQALVDGQVHSHSDEQLWRKDGASFLVDYTSTPVFQDNELTGAVVVFRDISAESEQATKLSAINANLLLANNELEEFAYVASHDLRTPLQGIGNLVEWIEEDLGEAPSLPVSKNLARIKERIIRLQHLIDDLLSYSRATKTDHELAHVSLGEVIDGLINDLDKGENFKFVLHGCNREIRIAHTPFQTVLRNLIDNAMKHHDGREGEIEISVHSVERNYISVSVIDDGPGIPLDQHQRIFRLFETLNGHKGTAGTGMGLALTKRLISKYGGEISLAIGDDGRGCCFTFTWPCQTVVG